MKTRERISTLCALALLAGAICIGVPADGLAEEAFVSPALPALLADGPRPLWLFLADKGEAATDPEALAAARA